MSLTKEDLGQIGKLIEGSETRLTKKIDERVGESENKIIAELGREVSDLATVNRAVINKTDELDCRLKIIERKFGIKAH